MRLIEVRLLDGPNLYRLEPVVKLEVAVGRRRTWYGKRDPEPYNLIRLSAAVPAGAQPARIAALAAWVTRLRREHPDGAEGRVLVHRSSDPGFWILSWPWLLGDRAREVAETAFALVERDLPIAKRPRPSGARRRVLERVDERIERATGAGPSWIRDADRRMPVVSISGTNGKTTTTRLTAHILRTAGRRVGATTSDGIVVGDELIEKGDWTGPGGAQSILRRDDLDMAVLETARGGILLRGMGYESNEASVITNVSSDHLDLQGIHTLPELAEVKGVIARVTKPTGTVVLNADDRWVAALAREVRAPVAFFSLEGDRSALVRRHVRKGGRAYVVRDGWIGEAESAAWRRFAPLADVPIALGGIARHNVANALAAAGAARAMGVSIEAVGAGLRSFRPTAEDAPGRLNVFKDDRRIVIVDFAHNEAGITVLLDVAAAMASTAKGSITAIIGTAGDRPDDTLRGLGRIAAQRADRVVIKETLEYLRGRSRASTIGELKAGTREGGWRREIPVFASEVESLEHELDRTGDGPPEVIVLLCHEQRDAVYGLLTLRGFTQVGDHRELAKLVAAP
ncbi:MAG TPA: Mur ligase family protein [Candidatus Limnocylindrales bacterium]|nr:Mur ligase family protein [Candidatus Limnocylindrales bacterium]